VLPTVQLANRRKTVVNIVFISKSFRDQSSRDYKLFGHR